MGRAQRRRLGRGCGGGRGRRLVLALHWRTHARKLRPRQQRALHRAAARLAPVGKYAVHLGHQGRRGDGVASRRHPPTLPVPVRRPPPHRLLLCLSHLRLSQHRIGRIDPSPRSDLLLLSHRRLPQKLHHLRQLRLKAHFLRVDIGRRERLTRVGEPALERIQPCGRGGSSGARGPRSRSRSRSRSGGSARVDTNGELAVVSARDPDRHLPPPRGAPPGGGGHAIGRLRGGALRWLEDVDGKLAIAVTPQLDRHPVRGGGGRRREHMPRGGDGDGRRRPLPLPLPWGRLPRGHDAHAEAGGAAAPPGGGSAAPRGRGECGGGWGAAGEGSRRRGGCRNRSRRLRLRLLLLLRRLLRLLLLLWLRLLLLLWLLLLLLLLPLPLLPQEALLAADRDAASHLLHQHRGIALVVQCHPLGNGQGPRGHRRRGHRRRGRRRRGHRRRGRTVGIGCACVESRCVRGKLLPRDLAIAVSVHLGEERVRPLRRLCRRHREGVGGWGGATPCGATPCGALLLLCESPQALHLHLLGLHLPP